MKTHFKVEPHKMKTHFETHFENENIFVGTLGQDYKQKPTRQESYKQAMAGLDPSTIYGNKPRRQDSYQQAMGTLDQDDKQKHRNVPKRGPKRVVPTQATPEVRWLRRLRHCDVRKKLCKKAQRNQSCIARYH